MSTPADARSEVGRLPLPPGSEGSEAAPERLRVLIADDHALFAEALTAMLGLEGWVEVVGRAWNGQEAVELAAELSPDLILLDLEMPIMDGIEATRRIRENSQVPLLILTSSVSPGEIGRARAAGASGFLRKDLICSQLTAEVAELGALRHAR